MKQFSIHCDRVTAFIGLLTVEIYWPQIEILRKRYGVFFPTLIVFANPRNWECGWSFAVRVFGFGVGVAWLHCSNPNSFWRK